MTTEPVRTPGSRHTDRLYRDARITGLSPEGAVRVVWLNGASAGGVDPEGLVYDLDAADVIYSSAKARGLAHGEALDEVFLTAFTAAQGGYLT